MSVVVVIDRFSTYSMYNLPMAVIKVPDGKVATQVFQEWYESNEAWAGKPIEEVLKSLAYAEYDVLEPK